MSLPELSDTVKELFSYEVALPSLKTFHEDLALQKKVASDLYGVSVDEIASIKSFGIAMLKEIYTTITGFNILLENGRSETFFAKEPKSHPLFEAVGITLQNLLLGEEQKFLYSDSLDDSTPERMIVIDQLRGSRLGFPETLKTEISYSFGIALELARTLALDDRHAGNILVSEKGAVRHLDNDCLFYHKDLFQGDYHIKWFHLDEDAVSEGTIDGYKLIRNNFLKYQPEIESMVNYFSKKMRSEEDDYILDDPFTHMKLYLGVSR